MEHRLLLDVTCIWCSYPETKGLAIEECPKVFRKHWFWKRYALIGFASENVSHLQVPDSYLTTGLLILSKAVRIL